MPSEDQSTEISYQITGDPERADHGQHYSFEVDEKLAEAYEEAHRARPRYLAKLLKLVDQYPRVPTFKNYLTVYYQLRNQPDKAFAISQRMVREHPDYLFGKINLSQQYIQRGQPDKVPELLGEGLDLQALFPGRKVFHFSEFENFHSMVCQYLIAVGELEAAEQRFELLRRHLPESGKLEVLEQLLQSERLKKATVRFEATSERRAELPDRRSYDRSIQTDAPPELHHPELKVLYREGMEIPEASLRELLALPRETLVADLAAILWDSVRRFEFFREKTERHGWIEEEYHFPLHAQFLLTELRAKDQLPLLLDCLRQGEDYLEFWYGDHLTETLWHFIYHLGQDQPDLLRDFLLEPDLHYSAKGVVSQAVGQIGLHQPERQAELLDWAEGILEYYLEQRDDPHLSDPDVNAQLIGELSDFAGATRLLPLIRRFYELDLVDTNFLGDLEEAEKMIGAEPQEWRRLPLFDDAFAHYQHITTRWYGYLSEEEQAAQDADFEQKMAKAKDELQLPPFPRQVEPPTPKVTPAKVGRNDPCPCGSGKKYKKCCWGKD